MTNLSIVRFVRGHGRYNRGELAGFTPEVARRLIASKVAVAYQPVPEIAASATAAGGGEPAAVPEGKGKVAVPDGTAKTGGAVRAAATQGTA